MHRRFSLDWDFLQSTYGMSCAHLLTINLKCAYVRNRKNVCVTPKKLEKFLFLCGHKNLAPNGEQGDFTEYSLTVSLRAGEKYSLSMHLQEKNTH